MSSHAWTQAGRSLGWMPGATPQRAARYARFYTRALPWLALTLGLSAVCFLFGVGIAETVLVAIAGVLCSVLALSSGDGAFARRQNPDAPNSLPAAAPNIRNGDNGPARRTEAYSASRVALDDGAPAHALSLSIVIPAQNEEGNLPSTIRALHETLTAAAIPFEIFVVNDHSTDATERVLQQLSATLPGVRYMNNPQPKGFGRAISAGLSNFRGDAVCIVMADASDDPRDVLTYYHKLQEGYECVFGSRFMRGSRVVDYPSHKLLMNRLANAFIKVLFHLPINDTTNAFKAYRREVIYGVSPIVSPHFNITVELPLKAIIRGFSYTIVPINWYNRKVGVSKLKIREMGSRYLFVVLIAWLEQKLARTDYRRTDMPTTSTLPHDLLVEETAKLRVTRAPRASAPVGQTSQTSTPLAVLVRMGKAVASVAVFVTPVTLLTLILWGIWTRTPQTLFWDEWQNVDMVVHLKQGTLQFADFWAFHNEHRIVIPRMLELALIDLSHWNEQVMMSFDLGLAIAEAGLLLAAVRRGLRSTGWMIALVTPFSLLVFSLGQYENWLWAFQITFICTTLGVAACVYGFSRQPASWSFFLLALLGAFLASWSSVGGTLAWVAFLPAAWHAGGRKGALWSVTGLVVLITYFQGFPHHSPYHFALPMLGFALGYLGAPLGGLSVSLSLAFGLLSVVFVLVNLAVYGWIWWTHTGDEVVALDAWVGLALFALAVDGVTTLGRYGLFGFSDFLTSRYQVFSVLWWVALLVLAAINARSLGALLRTSRAQRQPLPRVSSILALQASNVLAIACCCVALVAANQGVWTTFKNFLYTQRLDEACVANYQTAPDACLRGFVWDPTYLRAEAKILDAYHLSIFANNVGSTRPLIQYVDQQTGDQWATTTLVDVHSGYVEEKWLGQLYVNTHEGTQPVYQCQSNTTHAHFLSLQEACEGQHLVGIEGWIYSSPPASDTTTALYRCSNGKASFVWPDPSCNGSKLDMLLGYILSQSFPWQG